MSTQRWRRRPLGSNWSEFGPDDQRGRLNLIASVKVRQGLAEAKDGLTFCLSLPLDYPGGALLNPRRHPPALRSTLRDGRPNFNCTLADSDCTDVFNDDLAILHLQYSTQWDSLAHVGGLFDADGDSVAERVFYNGFRAGAEIVGPRGAHSNDLRGSGENRYRNSRRRVWNNSVGITTCPLCWSDSLVIKAKRGIVQIGCLIRDAHDEAVMMDATRQLDEAGAIETETPH